jgi:hypothetical protein
MATLNPAIGIGAYIATLATLRVRVLVRLGFGAMTANPPPGMATLIDDFLISAQRQLSMRHSTLVTERFYSYTCVAGTRFYTLATDDAPTTPAINPLRIKGVWIEDANGTFTPLTQGIDPQKYTMESSLGKPSHYNVRQSLELMPSPDDAYIVHIMADMSNKVFTDDAHVCSIDDELIFLLALANAKAHYSQPDAQAYFTQATSHLGQLTAGAHLTARFVPGPQGPAAPPKPVLV